jgi:hypothetical protein
MNKKAILLAALIALIVVALGSIYFTTFRGMPELNRQPYKDLGKTTAEEAIKLLGQNKRVSVIINREFGALKIPNLEVEMAALTTGLKEKGVSLESIEKVEMQKARFARPAAFSPVVESLKETDLVISLVGFPMSPGQIPAAFKNYKSKFIVVAPYEPGLKSLLQEGIIQVAIVPKFSSVSANAPFPQNFDNGFQVFTRDEAAKLP